MGGSLFLEPHRQKKRQDITNNKPVKVSLKEDRLDLGSQLIGKTIPLFPMILLYCYWVASLDQSHCMEFMPVRQEGYMDYRITRYDCTIFDSNLCHDFWRIVFLTKNPCFWKPNHLSLLSECLPVLSQGLVWQPLALQQVQQAPSRQAIRSCIKRRSALEISLGYPQNYHD